MTAWSKPLPVESVETKPYWDACREERLIIQRCSKCGSRQFPYRAFCSQCWSVELAAVDSPGTGSVWTYTVIRRSKAPGFAADVPYTVALVELDEGVKLLTNIVNCSPDDVAIGMRVRVTFVDTNVGWKVPVFEPIARSE